jgi:hypothetical protein
MIYNTDIQSTLIKTPEQLISILGIVYAHHKTSDGGDLYLTRYGLPASDLLEIENWYEKSWFESHRERLEGTSAVYKVRTKTIEGRSLDLVVKNSRVGEDVPLDTHTLLEFINAEFNSPWEEFAMVVEMRESKFSPEHISIKTQFPLAIYVPPETMQLWQSGRSVYKINRIVNLHPGIDIDILKQYKLIYGWIEGRNVVETLTDLGVSGPELDMYLSPITKKVIVDLDKKGYVVADMKPSHIIIDAENIEKLNGLNDKKNPLTREKQRIFIRELVDHNEYSIVDYELLIRTPALDEHVKNIRRHTYLDDQKNKFVPAPLPPYLSSMEIFGVPYIFGHVESTGGLLWVAGKNPSLFDYFLPERWRTTHHWKLSVNNDVYYTITKDDINIVWKTSRVGEVPVFEPDNERVCRVIECGVNSPFEEFAIAFDLNKKGVPSVYVRAIYMAGSIKQEKTDDMHHYESHAGLRCPDGRPVLSPLHNYVTIRGYYNGSDDWVAVQSGQLCRPVDLSKAIHNGIFTEAEVKGLMLRVLRNLENIGYDGSLLRENDLIIAYDPKGEIVNDGTGQPEVRITNFEYIKKI